MNDLERRLQKLEAQNSALERQLSELRVRAEIADLMGRYAVYYGAGWGERIVSELWSRDEENVSLEYGASGIYTGRWKIETFYLNQVLPGRLDTIAFSSPALIMEPDGTAVRGSWTALGTQTDAGDLGPVPVTEESNRRALFSSRTSDGKEYRAEVVLQRYEVTFHREDGLWRIYHLHVLEYFRCPYGRDWVSYAQERFASDGVWLESMFDTSMALPPEAHGENLPSQSTSSHWQYTVDGQSGQQTSML